MDQELGFPNPVERNDLPKRKNWRRRLLVLAILLLGTALVVLPQILSTRLGAKIVAAYMQRGCAGTVSVQSFSTHWFGPTQFEQVWIVDQRGRKIGFVRLSSAVSLLQLLRGHYDLGDAALEQPYVDYVLDYGDGSDTMDKFWPGAAFFAAGAPHPRLSGNITIHDGTVVFWRGRIAKNLVDTTFSAMQLSAIRGNVQADSLDTPMKFSIDGAAGVLFNPGGNFHATGQACFGDNGAWSPQSASMNAQASLQHLPGEELAVLFPQFSETEYQHMTGGEITSASVNITGSMGILALGDVQIHGRGAHLASEALLDLTGPSLILRANGKTQIATSLPPSVARQVLSSIDPFFIEADDAGQDAQASVTLDSFTLGDSCSATGRLNVSNLSLVRQDLGDQAPLPTSLTSRAAILVGDGNLAPIVNVHDGKFTWDRTGVTLSGFPMSLDQNVLTLDGLTSPAQLHLTVTLTSAPNLFAAIPEASTGKLSFALTGTPAAPQLDLTPPAALTPAATSALDDFINRQLEAVREAHAEILSRQRERAVQDKLRELSPASTEP